MTASGYSCKQAKGSRLVEMCDPEGIRTPDQQIRNLLLYPAELRDLVKIQKFNL